MGGGACPGVCGSAGGPPGPPSAKKGPDSQLYLGRGGAIPALFRNPAADIRAARRFPRVVMGRNTLTNIDSAGTSPGAVLLTPHRARLSVERGQPPMEGRATLYRISPTEAANPQPSSRLRGPQWVGGPAPGSAGQRAGRRARPLPKRDPVWGFICGAAGKTGGCFPALAPISGRHTGFRGLSRAGTP